MLYFLVTGKFEIYGQNGRLVNDKFFVNQILEVEHSDNIISIMADKATRIARMRAYLKYGKGIKTRRVFDIIMKRHDNAKINI